MWSDSFDSWNALRHLRDEVDRIFAGHGRPRAAVFPPVNIWRSPSGLLVTAELPGVRSESLEITAVQDGLTIRGERSTPSVEEDCRWHRRERRSGTFSRTIQLPFSVDADAVDASCRDGVLRIALTRPEENKPRRIEVKPG